MKSLLCFVTCVKLFAFIFTSSKDPMLELQIYSIYRKEIVGRLLWLDQLRKLRSETLDTLIKIIQLESGEALIKSHNRLTPCIDFRKHRGFSSKKYF